MHKPVVVNLLIYFTLASRSDSSLVQDVGDACCTVLSTRLPTSACSASWKPLAWVCLPCFSMPGRTQLQMTPLNSTMT